MPRPTAAQLTYGSCTVIFSTLAMLLLSQTSSGVGIAIISVSALALGLLVAMTVPLPRARVVAVRKPAHEQTRQPQEQTAEEPVPVAATGSSTAA
ncbi:hypothetical protein ABZT17_43640 [Streptomyces sp. NPDC005648]|uniref:hypothetical protein n=1 Tax=Streptomyces sp. NPDC005648 TaxID=3157044 RepID=UPI0033A3225A